MSPVAFRVANRLDGILRKLLSPLRPVRRLLRELSAQKANQATYNGFDWHEKMLSDRVRVEAYRSGIYRAVRRGDAVIDLGTGTGILAMLAATAGARVVYGIDHSAFIDVAREIAAHNGLKNVLFEQRHSGDYTCPEKVDLIIHEQMGHGLFGEHMVRNLLDLKRRALKPEGRIIPGRFQLYATPVSIKNGYKQPFIWEITDTGFDFTVLETHACAEKYRRMQSMHRLLKNYEVESFLAPPVALVDFDINEIESDNVLDTHYTAKWEIDQDGTLEGICFFFRAAFDDGTAFDTSLDQ
jgi:SAM-dependent methyltransferase